MRKTMFPKEFGKPDDWDPASLEAPEAPLPEHHAQELRGMDSDLLRQLEKDNHKEQ